MSTKLLTLADLAERWSVSSRSALKIVRANKIPFLLLSPTRDLSTPGPKSYRFRLEVVVSWESGEERQFESAAKKRRILRNKPVGVDADLLARYAD